LSSDFPPISHVSPFYSPCLVLLQERVHSLHTPSHPRARCKPQLC
jgi:hypothetical protein